MQIEKTKIEGLLVITPNVFKDDRGYFYESFNTSQWEKLGLKDEFVQDNQSLSGKGILRGLHFQAPPYAQGKLVRVIKGAVIDVAVDIRKDSPTYGESVSIELSEENFKMFWVPAGFAHGFSTLGDEPADLIYKITDGEYSPEGEGGILYNDPAFNIDWQVESPVISERDKAQKSFDEYLKNPKF